MPQTVVPPVQRPVKSALPGPCSRKLRRRSGVLGAEHLGEQLAARGRGRRPARGRGPRRWPAWPAPAPRPRPRPARPPAPGPGRAARSGGTTSSTRPMRRASSAFDLAAGEDQVLGPGGPDQAGQPLRAAAAGDDAEQDLGLAEHGLLGGDAEVAGQGQLAPAAEGVARRPRRSRSGGWRRRRRARRGMPAPIVAGLVRADRTR